MPANKVIGLTGGIGTGKSFVGNILTSLGFLVIDADQVAHEILDYDQRAILSLKKFFGEQIITKTGSVDRSILGSIVFNDHNELAKLNETLEPYIRKAIIKRIETAPKPLFFEIQLLFERNYDQYVDQVIVVYADNDTAAKRIQQRDKVDLKTAQLKILSQMPIEEKVEKADYLIDTTKVNVREQIGSVLKQIGLYKED